MRKFKEIIFVIIAIVFFVSCEEDFNPYGEFKDQYIFNCIIRGDTTFQIATLDKNYVVDGFNPYENHVDPAVRGAMIKIWANNTLKILHEGEVERADTSHYSTPYSYYYTDDFQPPEGSNIEVEVITNSGKKLTASCKMPPKVIITMVDSDKYIPPADNDFIKVRWGWEITTQVYVPALYLIYYKKEDGINVRHEVKVPISYEIVEDQYVPNYLDVTNNVAITYSMDVIDRTMEEISEGDPNKDNYTIYSAVFEVLALDDYLSKYYAATTVSTNGLSIKVDETDYTNINGGYGIFGAYSKSRYSIILSHAYIQSFGYVPGLTE